MREASNPDAVAELPNRLPDGTPFYGSMGVIAYDADEDRVQCHLCGGWFRAVASAHLAKAHGWTIEEYRQAFGLLKSDKTWAKGVRRTLAHHMRARVASGELVPPSPPYRPPPGSPGRGVRPTQSLGALHPELMAQLDSERNEGIDPSTLGPRSGRKLWWRCPDCAHVWSAAPHDRARGGGCPRCDIARRAEANRLVRHERSLAARQPEVAAEFHPTLNGELRPSLVRTHSTQRVWWQCSHCGHEWQATVATRARGSGCPQCARRALSERKSRVPRERSIAIRRPQLAAELHPTRNPHLDPFTLAAYSNQVLWWLCSTCGNEWRQAPYARWRAGRCPACR